jgi:hypothetical protein
VPSKEIPAGPVSIVALAYFQADDTLTCEIQVHGHRPIIETNNDMTGQAAR